MNRVKKNFWGNESGAVAVYAAIGMLVFMGCAALALDIAHMVSVKRELTKAAEAGALSGARGLWPVDISTATSRDPDCSTAQNWALNAAKHNKVDRVNLITDEVTVEVGRWDYATKQFTPGNNSSANGVRVTTQRNNVQMFLAQVFGQGPRNLRARAVAVMDFVSAVGAGSLPIAVNKNYTNPPFPHTDPLFINFTPDPSDNAGWFTDPPDPASAATLRDYIDGACPPLFVEQWINLNNGNDTTCLQDLADKLAAVQSDGGEWVVCLPVVDTDQFNQSTQIKAFCSFAITSVQSTGNPKGVTGTVLGLSLFQNALPGGGNSGALAPPKLVEGPPASGTR
jgi:Flp pilus assembly protein TadG